MTYSLLTKQEKINAKSVVQTKLAKNFETFIRSFVYVEEGKKGEILNALKKAIKEYSMASEIIPNAGFMPFVFGLMPNNGYPSYPGYDSSRWNPQMPTFQNHAGYRPMSHRSINDHSDDQHVSSYPIGMQMHPSFQNHNPYQIANEVDLIITTAKGIFSDNVNLLAFVSKYFLSELSSGMQESLFSAIRAKIKDEELTEDTLQKFEECLEQMFSGVEIESPDWNDPRPLEVSFIQAAVNLREKVRAGGLDICALEGFEKTVALLFVQGFYQLKLRNVSVGSDEIFHDFDASKRRIEIEDPVEKKKRLSQPNANYPFGQKTTFSETTNFLDMCAIVNSNPARTLMTLCVAKKRIEVFEKFAKDFDDAIIQLKAGLNI